MATEPQQLHVVFLPFMAHGHMIPTLGLARLFAARDAVKATIITTPMNMASVNNSAVGSSNGAPIFDIEVFQFPAQEAGMPEGYESLEQVLRPGLFPQFLKASHLLQDQLEQYLDRVRPDCLVADMFYPWATESAAKFNVPRLVFHGSGYLALSAIEIVRVHEPFKSVSSDTEPFVLPLLPNEIQLKRPEISEELLVGNETPYKERTRKIKESEVTSYGVIVNSFYELEPDYADFFRNQLGRRAWNVGPVSLGKQNGSSYQHECLKWLDSKTPNSVVYICFGSTASFIGPQLCEIAVALEASEQAFLWVVRDGDDNTEESWLPAGFEQRMEGKGQIVRGWAPQVLILEHEATGAFVTHCGWNSTLEGISAGVPMVTWPIFAEQFYNEKLMTQVLKTGVPVGAKKWNRTPSVEEMVEREAIEKALREIMVGKEVEERRARAIKLKEMAHTAVEDGGSSYLDLSALINELRANNKSDNKIC